MKGSNITALSAVALAGSVLSACASTDTDVTQISALVPNTAEMECRSGGEMTLYVDASTTVTANGSGVAGTYPRGAMEARLWVEPVEGRETKLKDGQCKLLVDDELLFPRLFNHPGNRSNDGKMRLNLRVDPQELYGATGAGQRGTVAISSRADEDITAVTGAPAYLDDVREMVKNPDTYRLPIDYSDLSRLLIGPPRRMR